MTKPASTLPVAIQSAANDFWCKLPDFTASSLSAQQGIALDGLKVRMGALRYLSGKKPDVIGSATQSNTDKLHNAMFNQDHLVVAAMLMQGVRKVCKHFVFNGQQQDPISWPTLGVVWQSTHDNADWDSLLKTADTLAKELGIKQPDFPAVDLTKELKAELAYTIAVYVLDPQRQSKVDIEPYAAKLVDDLVLHLQAEHSKVPSLSFEKASDKALDFLSTLLPEQFVNKLLVPQREIVHSVVSNAQLTQAQLMGRITPDEKGKNTNSK